MYKGLVAYSIIPVVVFIAFFSAFKTTNSLDIEKYSTQGLELAYNTPAFTEIDEAIEEDVNYNLPILEKCFVGFKEALAFKESRRNYFTVNTLGYLGKYQFGKNTLKLIGIYNTIDFLNNPELQEKAFIANAMRNKWILRRDIKRFVGKRIDGVLVTESGILAAAHLAGPGSVKKYLRSYGAIGFADAYGTTIRYYMKKFSGYDTSFIKADQKAKASLL
ncbi:peptidoglycan-binding protein LysM [Pontimicrobium aquaticum]|uniref:Peptidoglycan-binding protein LysM n=1 Tax=Pontimicrobium aquaticum TaxID=2565367 RepID=A0A4U0EW28_9FLAO|nr:peptidoglycan-binding protein LysM [Pontimicrobium aquaticum]TJY36105.1 peptidoglycan-binding protein LysM [Pontimicrobium aquaticum]